MTPMHYFVGVLMAAGFFCMGYAWGIRNTLFWRIEWIKLEHDLARKEGRKPREIREFEKEP